MDFRVYTIIEAPILDEKYEVLIPIDRRIHEVIAILKKNIPALSLQYYKTHQPLLYNRITGEPYDVNAIIKDSGIKNGTRLLLI